MGLTSGCWSLGLVVGPACGGLLASPATLYPSQFSSFPLFVDFPYLLPNLVTAFFGMLGFVMIALFFPETLHQNDKCESISSPQAENVASTHPSSSDPSEEVESSSKSGGASMMELCRTPGVVYVLAVYFVISLNSIVFDEIVPLWSMASPDLGGLGLPQVLIGYMMTFTGVILTIYTFTIYPTLAARLGDQMGFKVSMAVFGPTVILVTLLSAFPLSSSVRFVVLVVMYSLSKAMTSLGFACTGLMLNHCVPKDKRASLNGLAMTFGSIAKSAGPLSGALLFAWSLNSKYTFPLDYHFVFVVLFVASGVAVVMKLPDNKKNSVLESGRNDSIELTPRNGENELAHDSEDRAGYSSGVYQFLMNLFFKSPKDGTVLEEKRFGKYSTVSTLDETGPSDSGMADV